jgi:SAM-dependent methyltransferase
MNQGIPTGTSPRISLLQYPLVQIPRIAHRLARTKCEYETLRTWYLDLKFGGSCGGEKDSPFAALGMKGTQSAHYWTLDVLFRKRAKLQIGRSDVFVDVGCGKGRVINYWLHRGYTNRIVGVEIDPEIAELPRRRLERFPNVTIITGDICDNIPEDGTIFWLFNPFNEFVMRRFKRKLEEVFVDRRNVTLLYYLCYQVKLFHNDPNWRVRALGQVNRLPAALITMTPRLS